MHITLYKVVVLTHMALYLIANHTNFCSSSNVRHQFSDARVTLHTTKKSLVSLKPNLNLHHLGPFLISDIKKVYFENPSSGPRCTPRVWKGASHLQRSSS